MLGFTTFHNYGRHGRPRNRSYFSDLSVNGRFPGGIGRLADEKSDAFFLPGLLIQSQPFGVEEHPIPTWWCSLQAGKYSSRPCFD